MYTKYGSPWTACSLRVRPVRQDGIPAPVSRGLRVTRATLSILGLGLLIGCGGLFTAPGHANVAACRTFVARFNAFPCATSALDEADYCPDALDLSSCDMEPWYDCVALTARCDGGVMDLDQASCAVPACANNFQETSP